MDAILRSLMKHGSASHNALGIFMLIKMLLQESIILVTPTCFRTFIKHLKEKRKITNATIQ